MPETTSETERIDALVAEATPEAAAHLREIAESTPNKETRKSARRALYRLSQSGIVPSVPAAAAPVAHTPTSDTLRCFASAFDGAGNRLLFFILQDPDGGSPTLLQILINDEDGIRDTDSIRLSRHELAERLGRFEQELENGLALAEIEGDYGRWLLEEAHQISRLRRRQSPGGFLDWLARIGDPRARYDTPPVYAAFPPEEIRADTTLDRDPAALFALRWFDAWFFAVEDVIPWIEPWEQAGSSVVVVPEKVTQERQQRIVAEAVAALVTPEAQYRYRRRLEESADVLRRRGKETEARQALVHALALADQTSITEVPFACAIVQRTIEAAVDMVRAAREKAAQQPELGRNPQENRSERE